MKGAMAGTGEDCRMTWGWISERRVVGAMVVVLGLALAACAADGTAVDEAGPYRKKWVRQAQTSDAINSLALSPDGSLLAVCEFGVFLWDVKTGTLLREMKTPGKADGLYGFSPDGTLLATAPVARQPNGQPYGFSLVNVKTDAVRSIVGPYETGAQAVAFSPAGDVAVVIYGRWEKGTMAVYDAKTWEIVRMLAPDRTVGVHGIMALSPDNRHMAVIKYPDLVQIWDYRTGELVREFDTYLVGVHSLAYSPDGKLLATGGGSGIMTIDPITQKKVFSVPPDMVRLWDANTGLKVKSYFLDYGEEMGRSLVSAVSFMTTDKLVAAYGWGAYLLSVSGDEHHSFAHDTHARYATACCGGSILAAAGRPSRGELWRVAIWQRIDDSTKR